MKSLFKVDKRARSKWSCTKKHMARKMLAETNKQQAFKSSCQPPTKLHAEVFDIKHRLPHCYVTYRYSISRARNCDSLVANATRNSALATRFLELVASGRLTFTFFLQSFYLKGKLIVLSDKMHDLCEQM